MEYLVNKKNTLIYAYRIKYSKINSGEILKSTTKKTCMKARLWVNKKFLTVDVSVMKIKLKCLVRRTNILTPIKMFWGPAKNPLFSLGGRWTHKSWWVDHRDGARQRRSVRAVTILRADGGGKVRRYLHRDAALWVTAASPGSYSLLHWRGRPSCLRRSSRPAWTVWYRGQRAARCRSLKLSLTEPQEI